jgi:hypothetical protein
MMDSGGAELTSTCLARPSRGKQMRMLFTTFLPVEKRIRTDALVLVLFVENGKKASFHLRANRPLTARENAMRQ